MRHAGGEMRVLFPSYGCKTGGANPDSSDDIELYETHHDEDTDLYINVLSSKRSLRGFKGIKYFRKTNQI